MVRVPRVHRARRRPRHRRTRRPAERRAGPRGQVLADPARRARDRRVGLPRRRLPDGHRGRPRCVHRARRRRDARAHDARQAAGRLARQPRARAADGRPARRSLGHGPHRWHRRARHPPRPRREPRARRTHASRSPEVHRREGLDRAARRLAHGHRRRCRDVLGRDHPAHARGDDARRAPPRRPRQPRDRHPREARREVARSKTMTAIERVQRALDEIRAGKMVILVDDEDRENEGDLVFAAELVTPEHINFMATHARGLICLAMDDAMIDKLELAPMVRDNQASLGTAFTVSIEARHGVSTGISAKDRATTNRAAIADDAGPEKIVSPGHVFPLRARKGGVLVRTGQTEGSVDLARLAGLKPAGVICEIMREDGELARLPELEQFAAKHGLLLLSVADIIAYRLQREHIVSCRGSGAMRPGALGPGAPFAAPYYASDVDETEYLALERGEVHAAAANGEPVLVRVAALDPLADLFDLRPDLVRALEALADAGVGVFLYVCTRHRMKLASSFER